MQRQCEVLTWPKELQPHGGMDPGSRERERGVRTEGGAVGFVDVQHAIGGIAEQLNGDESDKQIVRLGDS